MTRPALLAAVEAPAAQAGPAATDPAAINVDKNDFSIPKPLIGNPGDLGNGRAVAINRKKGNCPDCHVVPFPGQPSHGRIAPPPMGVGARDTPAQQRLRVVDSKTMNPDRIMPSVYGTDGFTRPIENFAGKPDAPRRGGEAHRGLPRDARVTAACKTAEVTDR